jgi:hypothetical protein
MIKFIFSFLNFFLLFGFTLAKAESPQDTTTVVVKDSIAAVEPDDESQAGDSHESQYLPVNDSLFSFSENIRRVSGKQVDRYKSDPEYAYANDSEYWIKHPYEPGLFFRMLNSSLFRWIFLGFFAILILYGIYQLALENNFKMLIRPKKYKTEKPDLSPAQDKINFDEMIRINQAEGNYRMAVRFLYLRLIHNLRGKSGLSIHDSSTNAEIVRAFGSRPETARLRWLATAYEYVFYGEFAPNQETYFLLKNKFDAFQKSFTD